MIIGSMPKLASARIVHPFEIARLTNDPILGQISQSKIETADQMVRHNGPKEDLSYEAAMKSFRRRTKYPVTNGYFKLRKEH